MSNNGYLQYTPEKVMKIFNDIVLPRPRKIVDGFTFYNELAMLKYRLEVLYPFVDQFIISESTLTFSGKPKELYYENNKQLFSKYHDKIVHVIVDDMPETEDSWIREKHQRRCISRGFGEMTDSDIIMVSDLDEIPNPGLLQYVRKGGLDRLYCLKQDFYYYNLNTFVGSNWTKAKILPYSFFKKEGCEDLEMCRSSFYNVAFNFGGWHLSYFGNQKFISNKIKSFSHQEYNSEKYTSEDLIAERLKNGINLFDDRKLDHIPFEENKNLPPHYELLIKYIEEAN
jgi:beta-1,4-mannosyl-glycoprotein beta-1,4-N-acetylglucosaminyltransferase